jgi:energy-coupling factor transporter ATP-binding protein EcfA2
MKIKLKNEGYKSIKKLLIHNNIGNLCVLIGKNGAGKSHFLKAIDEEIIKIDNIEKSKIKYINRYSISTSYDIPPLQEAIPLAWSSFENLKQYNPPLTLSSLNTFLHQRLRGDNNKPYRELIYNALHGIIVPNQDEATQIQSIEFPTFKSHARYSDSLDLTDVLYGISSILTRELRKHLKDNEQTLPPLWEDINTQLKALAIPHKIKYPNFSVEYLLENGINNISYVIKLITSEEEEIDIDDLSDGEKTLFVLALMGIISHESSDFPELLLLDEPDIHLHPAMIDKFIDIINTVFIDNGCKVIITTHSPVIVSKVDGDSIYQIEKIGSKHKIVKQNQKGAVFILSDGVMNLDTVLDLVLKEAFDKDITILSEGDNIHHIENAIKILEPELCEKIAFPVYDYPKIQDRTGDTQLVNLYSLFSRLEVKNKILFIFDWDAEERVIKGNTVPEILKREHVEKSNVDYFIFKENKKEGFLERGIENLYNKYDMDGCTPKKGKPLVKWIKDNLQEPEAFQNFQPLVDKIEKLIKE